jgi:NAD(P)-dependent dehydrogenase (short-subunit alcohol dehydrogenase family)
LRAWAPAQFVTRLASPVARGPDRDAEHVQRANPIEKVRQAFVDRQPIGRLGKAEEIAAIAVYLSSDESAFATGQAPSSAAVCNAGLSFVSNKGE